MLILNSKLVAFFGLILIPIDEDMPRLVSALVGKLSNDNATIFGKILKPSPGDQVVFASKKTTASMAEICEHRPHLSFEKSDRFTVKAVEGECFSSTRFPTLWAPITALVGFDGPPPPSRPPKRVAVGFHGHFLRRVHRIIEHRDRNFGCTDAFVRLGFQKQLD